MRPCFTQLRTKAKMLQVPCPCSASRNFFHQRTEKKTTKWGCQNIIQKTAYFYHFKHNHRISNTIEKYFTKFTIVSYYTKLMNRTHNYGLFFFCINKHQINNWRHTGLINPDYYSGSASGMLIKRDARFLRVMHVMLDVMITKMIRWVWWVEFESEPQLKS